MFSSISKPTLSAPTLGATSLIVVSSLMLSGCGWLNRGKEAVMSPVRNLVPGGEMTETINLSPDASADYNGAYRNDPNNKAFAVSPGGAYGVAFGAIDLRQAKQAALEKCTQDVVPGDLECIVYDANGTVVFRPVTLRRVK
ncbi:MAG: hypothetical protein ACPGVN_00905 [Alphaproteobacteria bacterium]